MEDRGDAALLIDVDGDDRERRWAVAQSLGAALGRHPRVVDVVATYCHVFVSYDPVTTEPDEIRSAIDDLVNRPVTSAEPRRFVMPVVYGGDFGPDLAAVATLAGMAPDDVVELHSGSDWVVRFVGSPVGAPFLEGPRMPVSVPRVAEPRIAVPVGSVALSGFQSMIYNAPSPGGWQLIGRTPLRPFALDRTPHVPYRPGDLIRFRPIGERDWVDHP